MYTLHYTLFYTLPPSLPFLGLVPCAEFYYYRAGKFKLELSKTKATQQMKRYKLSHPFSVVVL